MVTIASKHLLLTGSELDTMNTCLITLATATISQISYFCLSQSVQKCICDIVNGICLHVPAENTEFSSLSNDKKIDVRADTPTEAF